VTVLLQIATNVDASRDGRRLGMMPLRRKFSAFHSQKQALMRSEQYGKTRRRAEQPAEQHVERTAEQIFLTSPKNTSLAVNFSVDLWLCSFAIACATACATTRVPPRIFHSESIPNPLRITFLISIISSALVMNILVGIAHVPDTVTKIVVGADGKSIDTKGVKFMLNPYDEFALEEALRLKEKHGGSITAASVGADSAKEVLRTALAMQVDKAILVKSDAVGDSFAVASELALLAKEINADVVLFGRQSIDFDSFQVAPMVAEILQMPAVTMTSKLDISGTSVTAERDIEGGKETIAASLPCVISAQKGLNEPRYPKLPDIMKAKSKPIEERAANSTAARTEVLSLELPPAKGAGKILGDSDADIAELVRLLHEEAKVI
jgi:electron transfer flavoprotein beta subunit